MFLEGKRDVTKELECGQEKRRAREYCCQIASLTRPCLGDGGGACGSWPCEGGLDSRQVKGVNSSSSKMLAGAVWEGGLPPG